MTHPKLALLQQYIVQLTDNLYPKEISRQHSLIFEKFSYRKSFAEKLFLPSGPGICQDSIKLQSGDCLEKSVENVFSPGAMM